MNSETTVLAAAFVLSIIASAYFAASETALSMSNRIRLKNLAEHGDTKAKKALYLTEEADEKTLITLLILTNIAHTAAASVATVFVNRIWGSALISACTFVTTLIMFVFGESIPKNYASTHSDSFTVANAGAILLLVKVLTPVSWLFSFIAAFFRRSSARAASPPSTRRSFTR